MIRLFVFLYDYFVVRKTLLVCLLAATTAGLLFSLLRLDYREDIAEFLPDDESGTHINAVYRHIGNSDRLIIGFTKTADSIPAVRIMRAIDRFTVLLDARDSLHVIPEVIAQVDDDRFLKLADFIIGNAPYFLTEAAYLRMDSLLQQQDFVSVQLRDDKRLLLLPSGGMMKRNIATDPLHLFSPLLAALTNLQAGSDEVNNGYIFSANGQKGMVFITSPYGSGETGNNALLLRMIEQTMRETEKEFSGVGVSCFGAPAIAVTNAERIKKDSMLAAVLSVILILSLLAYFFRNARNILLVFVSVLFGWLFALGVMALFKGSVSFIAVGIGTVFIGIAVNYPLHFIDHIRHRKDRKQALREIIPPLLTGNITTVGAFFSLLFISSDAMRDFGLFGSLLLVGSILFVLVFLPHLVRGNVTEDLNPATEEERLIFGKFARFAPERKKPVLLSALLLTALFLYLSRFAEFEADMHKINYMTDAQRTEMNERMQSLEKAGQDVVYFLVEGGTTDEALAAYERNVELMDSLHKTGWVENVAGIASFLPSQEEQQRRIERWNAFWQPRRDELLQQVDRQAVAEGFRKNAFGSFAELLRKDFSVQDGAYFDPLTPATGNYLAQDEGKTMVITLLYCNKTRTAALKDVLKTHSSSAFVLDSRSMGQRMVDALYDDFNYVLYVCGCVVFIFLVFSFRRIELSIMSFLPLAVGWVWILGIMQICGIRFNIVNIILATFIFGQGDDYTIFITEGLIYEYARKRKMLASYKNSIILSALIMFTGIGVLIFAQHPAMRSLANVTMVGMFSVVMMAYLLPPFIFRWLTVNRYGPRTIPVTVRRLLASGYAFAAFLVGSLAITVFGSILFGGSRQVAAERRTVSYRKRKLLYHRFLCAVARFTVKRIPGVSFRYENLSGETFDKPAVIICNHQAHIDLMCLMMLTPRMVILTNEWVWNNPFYKRLIRYADFYPVSGGIENSVKQLSVLVREGYSVAVFPEGTRSEDCSIRRFHHGAFYLAEMLHLDILPVLLHGAGHVLPKKDFMLRRGAITVQVCPRIAADDTGFGDGYSARAKQITPYYRNAFAALSLRLETAAYYRSFVLHNYYYKGADVERSVGREMKRLERSGELAKIDAWQGNSHVRMECDGYGIYAFLFALVHKQTQVTAVFSDTDKATVTAGCTGCPANLTVQTAS
ncbi:MAG: 1-acyl-sn-glycerol-3-phosphate acyltransferase [Bacteroidales bacterium]|jgi:1-acyl-sn-glycerol-3-phosphate acyltransferase|nr:1-acyl-sn-glycerol-3-phosphate acyltransferase [Bacteroidales bacterium]